MGQTGQTKSNEQHRKQEITEQQWEAFRLWREEKTDDGRSIGFRAIGEKLGVSHETARQYVYAALDRVTDEFTEDVRKWKIKQLHKLMAQWELFAKITEDETAAVYARVAAGRLCNDLIKQISEITGTKAAQNLNINVSNCTDEELEAIAKA